MVKTEQQTLPSPSLNGGSSISVNKDTNEQSNHFLPVGRVRGGSALLGMTLEELQDVCLHLSMPKFTAKQMAQWIYGKHVHTIDEMTNLSKANREKLDSLYSVGCMAPVETQKSTQSRRRTA